MRRSISRWLALAALIAAPGAAHAQAATDNDPKGVWSLTIENDSVAGTDRDYTNGGLISYVGPKIDQPQGGRFARDHLKCT